MYIGNGTIFVDGIPIGEAFNLTIAVDHGNLEKGDTVLIGSACKGSFTITGVNATTFDLVAFEDLWLEREVPSGLLRQLHSELNRAKVMRNKHLVRELEQRIKRLK